MIRLSLVALTISLATLAAIGANNGSQHRATSQQSTVTPTLAISPTMTITPTATITPTVGYVYVQTDADMRIDACEGLAHMIGTVPPPLAWCNPVDPCDPCPPGGAGAGQGFILWPGAAWRYRVYRDSTPTPGPIPTCEVVYIVVTATPSPTDTATATITPNAIATYVAGTLTALAPTATDIPRPTDTRVSTRAPEATPTPAIWRLTLFPVLRKGVIVR